jgi:hypothetical protein
MFARKIDYRRFDRKYGDYWASWGANPWSAGVPSPWQDPTLMTLRGYAELSERFAGLSFDRGIYRLHDSVSGPKGQALVAECFPAHAGTRVFGYDWRGRQYAADPTRPTAGAPAIVVLDPTTGEVRPVARDLVELHDRVLVAEREALLQAGLLDRWLPGSGAGRIERDQCVGLASPAAGAPTVENLRLSTMEIYWDVCVPFRSAPAELRRSPARGKVDADLFRA